MSVEGSWGGDESLAPLPARVGRFALLRKLGTGGMGEVWLAQAHAQERFGGEASGELVALKRMLGHLAYDTRTADMFLDEARIASRLDHPSIVKILEVGKDGDIHYFAMEFVEGETLGRIMERLRKRRLVLPPALAAKIGAEALAGLHHAHTRTDPRGRPLHIIHRDVTPPNIMVTDQGAVKVLDFGIAKAVDRAARTEAGAFKGKIEYLAPEQIQGAEPDPRADLFALGAVLWEALTGRKLFVRETMVATLAAISEARVLPPSRLSPEVPPELDAIVLRALERSPHDRFPSAEAMERALRMAIAHEPDLDLGLLMTDLFAEEQAARDAERQLARMSAGRRLQPPSPSMSGETEGEDRARFGSGATEEPTQVGLQRVGVYAEPELPDAVAANFAVGAIDTGSAVMTMPGDSEPRVRVPAGLDEPRGPRPGEPRAFRPLDHGSGGLANLAGQHTAMLSPGDAWGTGQSFDLVDAELPAPVVDAYPPPFPDGTDADVAPSPLPPQHGSPRAAPGQALPPEQWWSSVQDDDDVLDSVAVHGAKPVPGGAESPETRSMLALDGLLEDLLGPSPGAEEPPEEEGPLHTALLPAASLQNLAPAAGEEEPYAREAYADLDAGAADPGPVAERARLSPWLVGVVAALGVALVVVLAALVWREFGTGDLVTSAAAPPAPPPARMDPAMGVDPPARVDPPAPEPTQAASPSGPPTEAAAVAKPAATASPGPAQAPPVAEPTPVPSPEPARETQAQAAAPAPTPPEPAPRTASPTRSPEPEAARPVVSRPAPSPTQSPAVARASAPPVARASAPPRSAAKPPPRASRPTAARSSAPPSLGRDAMTAEAEPVEPTRGRRGAQRRAPARTPPPRVADPRARTLTLPGADEPEVVIEMGDR